MELHLEVAEWVAIVLLYGDGHDWRERVAARVLLQWGLAHGTIARRPGVGPADLADRLTGEGG